MDMVYPFLVAIIHDISFRQGSKVAPKGNQRTESGIRKVTKWVWKAKVVEMGLDCPPELWESCGNLCKLIIGGGRSKVM